jgi:hypothetical protein
MIQLTDTILRLSTVIILLSLCNSCKKDKVDNQTSKNLHGKYAIVSATTDNRVDVNFDGVSSIDLLKEIPALERSYLELIRRGNSGPYIYSQFWQNQYFQSMSAAIPTKYDPEVVVNYMNQPTVASFTFREDESELVLSRSTVDSAFPLPGNVTILPDDQVRVRMFKDIYTMSGWVKISIDIVYKKFTDLV